MTQFNGSAAQAQCVDATLLDGSAQRRGLLRRLFANFLLWRRMRRDAAALYRQPDYILRDIGIGRSEIESAIRGRRWR